MNDKYIIHKNQLWTKHGSYLYAPFPGERISSEVLDGAEEDYLFARHSYDFDIKEETDWWYIVKDRREDISDYSSNHRNQIKKGLKNFTCRRLDHREIIASGYHVYKTCMDNYKLSAMDTSQYVHSINFEHSQDLQIEYFGLYNDEALIGYGKNIIDVKGSFVFYENIYIDIAYRKLYPNYCLMHIMNTEYLNTRGFKYVSDGTRTLLHPTGIQEFLEKKFLFRKAYCRLQLFYSSKAKFGVPILSKIDYVTKKSLSNRNPKIKALVLQHEIFNSSSQEHL